ncbi:hypothetical protein VTK56DRAFT_5838 [Thermocarpiscus australiensis]
MRSLLVPCRKNCLWSATRIGVDPGASSQRLRPAEPKRDAEPSRREVDEACNSESATTSFVMKIVNF